MMDMLSEEMGHYERYLSELAEKVGELAGSECSLGYCRFNPNMDDVQEKLDELKERSAAVRKALALIERCGALSEEECSDSP
jgi:putative heme degradation protein